MHFPSLLLTVFALSPGLAQGPTASNSPAETAIGSGFGLWHEAEALCGGGPLYRVEFDARGMSYVPALADAPRTFSLRLELESLRRGTTSLATTESPPARRGSVAEYDRGPGIVERYALSAKGVKQSLVLTRHPTGDGSITVRLRVRTDLTPDRVGDVSSGMRWLSPRWGGVEIGRATAIDARGHRFAMRMRCEGEALDLTLPAAAAAAANYPLVLDPPIGTLLLVSGTNPDSNPDIAYDATSGRYLAVWNRRLSATRSEIRGHLLLRDGSLLGSLMGIATGTTFASNPTVANVNRSDRFMVVWQEASSVLGPWGLFGRTVEPGGLQGPRTAIAAAIENDVDPDLGGNATTTSSSLPLIWQRVGRGLLTTSITVPAIGSFRQGSQASIGSTAGRSPRISKSGGDRGFYVATWETRPALQNPRIDAAIVNASGTRIAGPITVSSGTGVYERPAVDGDGTNFMVVYQRQLGAINHDVLCRTLRYSGILTATTTEQRIGVSIGDQTNAEVGWLGPKYLVAWADNANRSRFLEHDLHLMTFSSTCEPCGLEHVVRKLTTSHDHDPAIASQRSAGGTGDEALVVFSALDNRNFRSQIRAHRFRAFGGGGSAPVVSAGCGNGGTMSFDGPLAYGNTDLNVFLRGADPSATLAALYAGITDSPFACGSCRILNPLVAIPVPIVNGAATLRLPQSCALLRFGPKLSADLQWVMVGGASRACPLIPSFATSGRVRFTLGF